MAAVSGLGYALLAPFAVSLGMPAAYFQRHT
jgi:hypothetical protein